MKLTVNDVTASYGHRTVLDGVSFDLDAGEMVAVLGPSGCGKTTLLRTIAGLHRVDGGTVELDGRVVERAPGTRLGPEHRRIGLMPQEGGLFPHLDVRRNIEFGLRSRRSRAEFADKAARRRRVADMAELVGMPDALDTRPSDLSGGQQQRIALARALAPNPTVVLMDEPFAALDAGLRATLRADVREMLRHNGTSSILVTHDQAEALGTADRVAVLLDGRCEQIGTPREVYLAPATEAVARFVGDGIFLDVVERDGPVVSTLFGNVRVPVGTERIMVRPEQLVAVPDADGDFDVVATHFMGAGITATVRHIASGTTFEIPARAQNPGGRVGITVDGPVAAMPSRPVAVEQLL